MSRSVKCPTCRTAHPYNPQSSFRPFCSERCRLIDLGAWSQESYKIPVQDGDAGLDGSADDSVLM